MNKFISIILILAVFAAMLGMVAAPYTRHGSILLDNSNHIHKMTAQEVQQHLDNGGTFFDVQLVKP